MSAKTVKTPGRSIIIHKTIHNIIKSDSILAIFVPFEQAPCVIEFHHTL